MPAGDKQKTGPVRFGLRYGGSGDGAARARPVLYDDGLPDVILELLRVCPESSCWIAEFSEHEAN
jgi:hypothetical protein